MQKLAIGLAALAAISFSGMAFAEEATEGSGITTPAPAAMTDAEMDKVTAGDQGGIPNAASDGNALYGKTTSGQAPHGGNAGGRPGNCPSC